MKTCIRLLLPILFITTFIIYQCSTDEVAGIEITNGDCTGKIYNTDNTAAVGAVVRLIPSGYDPASGSAVQIDSTETDARGSYLFRITKTDFYNVFAENGDVSCIQNSVSLLADDKNQIDPDTLEASGWLAGRIEVKPGSDPLQAILIIPGTNRYTSPYDSIGNFPTLQLPAGIYTVNVYTTENGYETAESSITVPSGDTVYLNARIPTSYAPEIQGFDVAYDSATMFATIRWEPADTSSFRSFALHRYVNGSEDSIIIIDKSITEYTDDCITYFENSLQYKISSIGDNFKEGYPATTEPFVVSSKTSVVTKTPLDNFTLGSDFRNICTDYHGNIYLADQRSIKKIAADGSVVNEGFEINIIKSVWDITSDIHNNIYVYNGHKSETVVYKLDSNLKFLASFTPPDMHTCAINDLTLQLSNQRSVFIGEDGRVFVQNYCVNSSVHSTAIQVYDSNFNYQNTVYLDGEVSIGRCYGDTIITATSKYPEADIFDETSELQIIKVFDRSFNLLSSYESMHTYSLFGYLMEYPGRQAVTVFPRTGNYSMGVIGYGFYSTNGSNISSMILIIYDNSGNLLGRLILPGDFSFDLQSSEQLVGISHFFGPVLYTINLTPFLSN